MVSGQWDGMDDRDMGEPRRSASFLRGEDHEFNLI